MYQPGFGLCVGFFTRCSDFSAPAASGSAGKRKLGEMNSAPTFWQSCSEMEEKNQTCFLRFYFLLLLSSFSPHQFPAHSHLTPSNLLSVKISFLWSVFFSFFFFFLLSRTHAWVGTINSPCCLAQLTFMAAKQRDTFFLQLVLFLFGVWCRFTVTNSLCSLLLLMMMMFVMSSCWSGQWWTATVCQMMVM